MRFRRPGVIAAMTLLAAAVAAAGAAANLHLLEPQRRSREPMVLGIAVDRSTTSETAGPPATLGGSGEGTTTTAPPPTTAPTTPPTTGAAGAATSTRHSYAVGRGGSVRVAVRSGTLALESVTPSPGWTYAIEDQRTDQLEIRFRQATGDGEAAFHASVDGGGVLRVEIDTDAGESPDD